MGDRRNTLGCAALAGDEDILRQLLAQGADPNDRRGQYYWGGAFDEHDEASPEDRDPAADHIRPLCAPLWLAARGDSMDVGSRGPFNTIGPSARRHAGVVRALLEAGADASCHNSSAGTTALHEAAKSGNDLALRLLIGSPGIDLNARAGKHYPTGIHVPHYTDTRAGKTALHFAAEAAEYGFTDAVEMLLEAGADPTVRAVNERGPGTAAELAQSWGNPDAAAMLRLEPGALRLCRARQRLAFAKACLAGTAMAPQVLRLPYDMLVAMMSTQSPMCRLCADAAVAVRAYEQDLGEGSAMSVRWRSAWSFVVACRESAEGFMYHWCDTVYILTATVALLYAYM